MKVWTFLITPVSILSHNAKKISLLSPDAGSKSINYWYQPFIWKVVLFSHSSHTLDVFCFIGWGGVEFCYFRDNIFHLSIQSSEHILNTYCVSIHSVSLRLSQHWRCVPADTSTMSTLIFPWERKRAVILPRIYYLVFLPCSYYQTNYC